MASSYLNIVSFIITTIFYYISLKPKLDLSKMNITDKDGKNTYMDEYNGESQLYLGIYFLLVIIIQFLVNNSLITSNCGGNISDNIGFAAFITLIPWTLIFGVIIIVLLTYPGFISAFSDVIGYFYVSSEANKILTELLVNKEVQDIMGKDETPSNDLLSKKKLEDAAYLILKICGNSSVLINLITPQNFLNYWKNIFQPIKKIEYQDDTNPKTIEIQQKLFELVETRNNIGEAMWYIYVGLLAVSITQLKIANRGCVVSQATMEKNYQQFLANEEKAREDKTNATQTYTIT
jgi:hypothetical protein